MRQNEGTIKRLVVDRGFGFIRDQAGVDWFFHHAAVIDGPFDVHHLIAHPLLALSGGARWAWRFHDWTLPFAWPQKSPIEKRAGLR